MKRNFLLTTVVFVLSAAIFWTTITQLDPLGAQRGVAMFSFFVSVLFGVSSFFTFFFFFSSELFSHRRLGTATYLVAMRRGVLVGILAVLVAALRLYQLLDFWQIILCAIFLFFVELVFLMAKRF